MRVAKNGIEKCINLNKFDFHERVLKNTYYFIKCLQWYRNNFLTICFSGFQQLIGFKKVYYFILFIGVVFYITQTLIICLFVFDELF
jgi:hypothetical protein